MGFPIRKSADQSLFAAPHGLSQRTTSFIASQRQGIHRIPLRHLIALIIDAHRSAQIGSEKSHNFRICGLGRGHTACAICGCDRKTICFEHIREHRGQADAHNWQLVVSNACEVRSPRTNAKKPNLRSINDRICFLFTMTDSTRSAHAPAYSVDPRTTMSRNARRRQSDRLVEPDGIEPTTSCLQSTRSPN